MKEKSEMKIRATKSGRLYWTNEDFFSCPDIQQQIKDMMESSIVKKIISTQTPSPEHRQDGAVD